MKRIHSQYKNFEQYRKYEDRQAWFLNRWTSSNELFYYSNYYLYYYVLLCIQWTRVSFFL